jgi:hypothetical protein
MIEKKPYHPSRNPLFVGLVALYLGLALLRWSNAVARIAMASSDLDVVSRNRISGAFDPDEADLVVTEGV